MRAIKLLLVIAITGCDDPLKSVQLIEETRVLGAKVEVEGAPERATPFPSEAAKIRVFVAAPEPAPKLSWAFSVCSAKESNGGIPDCERAPFASASVAEPTALLPELSFTVPAHEQLGTSGRALLRGVVCPVGQALENPLTLSCAKDLGQDVSFEFDLASEQSINNNPSFDSDSIALDDVIWPESSSAFECSALPTVRAGSGAHTLKVSFAEDAREALIPESDIDPSREGLLVSHFSTSGKLERAFSNIEPNARESTFSVAWTAPKSVETSQVARFYFVVRDLRGGADFSERAVCVVP